MFWSYILLKGKHLQEFINMTGSQTNKTSPIYTTKQAKKTIPPNLGLCLYYHHVQFLRVLLSDCVFAFSPGNIGTVPILVFMSMAVSDFECRDSTRTLRLLQVVNIVISVEILLQRQKHSPWLVRHSRSSTSQLLQH